MTGGGACIGSGVRYDAYTFVHGGGLLSLLVRGFSTDGGTLPDPVVYLFTGPTVPADFCGWVATDDNSICNLDAYLVTEQPAGTYTFAITDFDNSIGTYTVERNGFTGPCPGFEFDVCSVQEGNCLAGLACCPQEISEGIFEDRCTALGTTSGCLSCADSCAENEAWIRSPAASARTLPATMSAASRKRSASKMSSAGLRGRRWELRV